jgi:serine/threonine protein kinase
VYILKRRGRSADALITSGLPYAADQLYSERVRAQQLLQDWPAYEEYQYDRQKLTMQDVLGEGQFGKVFLANARGIVENEEETKVAVKTTKVQSGEAAEDFRKEIEIMTAFEHPNIIALLGVCTTEFPLYIILEFMSEGDLKNFLTKARPDECNPTPGLTLYHLLDICRQVSSGLAHMASIKFVHRDIAARNCLVGNRDGELVVKVSDFGMARNIYQREYYSKDGGMLPLRWMAPEAVTDGRNTTLSDVWSFGVLMWEVFTFGYLPYYDLKGDQVIFNVVHGTIRLRRPENCPVKVYELMQKCWMTMPTERIKAAELETELQTLVNECENSGYSWQQTWGSRDQGQYIPMDNVDANDDQWQTEQDIRYMSTPGPSPHTTRQPKVEASASGLDQEDVKLHGNQLSDSQLYSMSTRPAKVNEYDEPPKHNPLFGIDFSPAAAESFPQHYANVPLLSDKTLPFDVKDNDTRAATDAIMPDYEEPTDIDEYDNTGEVAETSFLY